MHSQNRTSVTSYVGGQKKVFSHDGTPHSKRLAEAERAKSDNAIISAINSRTQQIFGRPASPDEIRKGIKLPDIRTDRERIAQGEVNHTSGRDLVRDPNANVWAYRVAQLEADLLATPPRLREPIQSRLEQARSKAAHFEREQAAKAEHAAKLEAIASEVALSQSWISLLTMSGDGSDQRYLEAAQKAHLDLIASGDKAAYRAASDKWQAERKAEMKARADVLAQQAATLEQLAELAKDSTTLELPAETSTEQA